MEEASESETGSCIRWRLGAREDDGLDWVVVEGSSFSQGSVRAMSATRKKERTCSRAFAFWSSDPDFSQQLGTARRPDRARRHPRLRTETSARASKTLIIQMYDVSESAFPTWERTVRMREE